MPNLSDEMNVNPRHRITIPEGHGAIVLPVNLYEETLSLLGMIRRAGKRMEITPEIKAIAGDLVLAAMDTVPHSELVQRLTRDRK